MAILPRFAGALARTTALRLRRGPLVASWSFPFEASVAFLRATSQVTAGRSPLEQRAVWAELRSPPSPVMRRVRRSRDGAGGVRAEWFEPAGYQGEAVVLFFHGGSFIFGSMVSHGEMVARIALASGARVLALDYRLVPEHRFPAPVEDATTAYRWLLSQGVPPGRIVFAGDSAGGNLTVATLLALRDEHQPLPAGAVPISPWVDLARSPDGGSLQANARYDWGVPSELPRWAAAYAGAVPLTTPRVSPGHADLTGLPPLHVLWGSREMLRDQVVELVARARAAGVAVEGEEYPNMVHGWMALHSFTLEAERAYQSIGRFVRRVTR